MEAAPSTSLGTDESRRAVLVARGVRLNDISLAYNALEAVVALVAGIVAGSVALVGFGFDSVIEVTAAVAARWRLHSDVGTARRARSEYLTIRIIGYSFLALAAYVAYESISALVERKRPEESEVGIGLALLSVVVMPILSRAKSRVANGLGSGALAADAQQTALCAYLSAILLAGLALNAALGWWWADPVAALVMVPIIAHEGIEGVRGRSDCCADDCGR